MHWTNWRTSPLRPPVHHRSGTALRGLQPALRTGLHPGDHQPALRRVDRGLRVRKAHRRAAGPSHPPRAHPGDERRELPPQGQPAKRRRTIASAGSGGCWLAPRRCQRQLHRQGEGPHPVGQVRAVRHHPGGTVLLRPSCRRSAKVFALTGQQKCHIHRMENVTLNPKEQARLQVLNSLLDEHMTLDQAAMLTSCAGIEGGPFAQPGAFVHGKASHLFWLRACGG